MDFLLRSCLLFSFFLPKNFFATSERLNESILDCLRKANVFFIILDHLLQERNRIEMPQIVRFRQHCRKTPMKSVLHKQETVLSSIFSFKGSFFETFSKGLTAENF